MLRCALVPVSCDARWLISLRFGTEFLLVEHYRAQYARAQLNRIQLGPCVFLPDNELSQFSAASNYFLA
jgi:hypothetical protein